MAQLVKNLPVMRETWVQSLGWEGPLEKEKGYSVQYSGHGLCSPWSRKESDTTERLSLSLQPLDHQESLKTLTLLFTASSRGSRLSPILSTQPAARCGSHSHILSFRHRTLPTNGYSLGYQLSPELCSLKQ